MLLGETMSEMARPNQLSPETMYCSSIPGRAKMAVAKMTGITPE